MRNAILIIMALSVCSCAGKPSESPIAKPAPKADEDKIYHGCTMLNPDAKEPVKQVEPNWVNVEEYPRYGMFHVVFKDGYKFYSPVLIVKQDDWVVGKNSGLIFKKGVGKNAGLFAMQSNEHVAPVTFDCRSVSSVTSL